MDRERQAPLDEAGMRDLREIAENLPPANDMESNALPPEPARPALRPAFEKVKRTLARVRWSLLAMLATTVLSLGGALAVSKAVGSDVARWAATVLLVGALLAVVLLLDVALQWSERAMFALVRKQEARFLAEAGNKAAALFEDV